jgi:hypothetical protein
MSYRHNGHALVKDNLSDISRDSFCDRDTEIDKESFIHSSYLRASVIESGRIADSRLFNCVVLNSSLFDLRANESVVQASFLTHADIERCRLDDCLIRPGDGGTPKLKDVGLQGVVVDGSVDLEGGWILEGNYYIHCGKWNRSPRAMMLSSEGGIRVGLSECTDGRAHIGQRCHSIEQWLRVGPRLGRMIGWDIETVGFARLFLESLQESKLEAA